MAEYIEREALIRQIDEGFDKTDPAGEEQIGFLKCRRIAREFPAADVAPVVRGRWVGLEYDGYADGNPVYDLWECSECGEEVRGEDVPETHPYCHGCGAKMEG